MEVIVRQIIPCRITFIPELHYSERVEHVSLYKNYI